MISEMREQLDRLCELATKSPKPCRSTGIAQPLQKMIGTWQVCDYVSSYLACLPSHGVEFGYLVLFDFEGIIEFSQDDLAEVCQQGFLPIAMRTTEGDPYLLDTRSGAVYLFSHERVCTGCLFETDRDGTTITYENVRRLADETYFDICNFLSYLCAEVEANLSESCWFFVAGGMDRDPGSRLYWPEAECVNELKLILATSLEVKALRNEDGKSLLEIARERGRPMTVPILETYWEDPGSFKISPDACSKFPGS